MFNLAKKILILLFLPFISLNAQSKSEGILTPLDSKYNLFYGETEIIRESDSTSIPIYILRFDPEKFAMDMLSVQKYHTSPKTTSGWSEEFKHEIVFNAGMFMREDNRPVGYCRDGDLILNGNKNHHNSFFVFNAKRKELPAAQILDRQCDLVDSILTFYDSHLQGIRMLSCVGENCWKKSSKQHSILALAIDSNAYLLLLFVQEPIDPHDFIEQVSKLKLNLAKMMYLEGGVHSSLFVESGNLSLDLHGYSDKSLPIMNLREIPMPLPIVIGLKRK